MAGTETAERKQYMAIYLVDFENIGYNGLKGIEKLPEGDQVHLFYSSNADKLTFDIHLCINASKARIFYYKVETGAKNALDFQLATYLGSLTAQNPDENYFIVSNDDGFHYIIQFWKQRGVDIQQISNLQFQSIEENQVLDLLPAFCRDDADEIMACINEFKSKQGINNALVKQFGNKKGSEIYRAIKGLLKN